MSGINNVSVNNAVTGVIQEQLKAAENAQKKVSEEASSDNTAANPVDTLELSARAQSLLNKVSSTGDSPESAMQPKQESAGQEITPKTSEKEQSSEPAATSTAEVKQGPKPAPVKIEASSSDDEEDEDTSYTTNLVSLSETEMLEMVMEGSISRADMEAELARRGIATE